MNRILKSGIQDKTKMKVGIVQLFVGKRDKDCRYRCYLLISEGKIWASMDVFEICLRGRTRVVRGRKLKDEL